MIFHVCVAGYRPQFSVARPVDRVRRPWPTRPKNKTATETWKRYSSFTSYAILSVKSYTRRPYGPLREKNMTSSIKPEVHNVLQCFQSRTEPRKHSASKENLVKLIRVVHEIRSRIYRQTNPQTDRQTDMLVTIVRTPRRQSNKKFSKPLKARFSSKIKHFTS